VECLTVHGADVVVVQVQPDQLTEARKLAGPQAGQAVVAQGEALGAHRDVVGHVAEGGGLAVDYFTVTSAARGTGPLPGGARRGRQAGRQQHRDRQPS